MKYIKEILRLVWKLLRTLLGNWLGEIIKVFLKKALIYLVLIVGFVAAVVVLIKFLVG